MFRIYLTGRVTFEGSVVVDESALPGPLGRSLAAVLALSRGPVSRARLADILWDENPPRAYDRSINPLLSKLRAASEKAGGPRDLFMSGSGTVELRRSPEVWIDLEHATIALDAAEGILRAGFPRQAWSRAAVATSILGRPFLEGIDLAWVEERRRLLGTQLVRAYEVTVDVWMALGDAGQSVVAARRLLAADRYRETSHEKVIRAHLLAGNRAEALRAFGECARLLREDLGVEPSAPVQAAYEEALGAS